MKHLVVEDLHNSWLCLGSRMCTTDDAKAKHVFQVQEDLWNNITKSCVYIQLINVSALKIYTTLGYIVSLIQPRVVYIFKVKMFHQEASVETFNLKCVSCNVINFHLVPYTQFNIHKICILGIENPIVHLQSPESASYITSGSEVQLKCHGEDSGNVHIEWFR